MKSLFPLVLLLASLTSSCGVLVGNIRPVDEKSENYAYLDLTQGGSDWIKLQPSEPSAEESPDAPSTLSDVAFQSKKTAAIISVNSACRPSQGAEPSLKSVSNLLFLGITDIRDREERQIELQGEPALETTLQGSLHGEPTRLKTIVFRKKSCTYDLMHIARPDRFQETDATFSRFIAALRLK